MSRAALPVLPPSPPKYDPANEAAFRQNLAHALRILGGDSLLSESGRTLTLDGELVINGQGTVSRHNAGNSGTAKTLDWDDGNVQALTMTGDCTLTLSNPVAGAVYVLELVQDATGNRAMTWPGTVKWGAAGAPTLSGASLTDLVTLYWNGTSYLGSYTQGF